MQSRWVLADYDGKDLWKRRVLGLEWNSECVMEGESDEQVGDDGTPIIIHSSHTQFHHHFGWAGHNRRYPQTYLFFYVFHPACTFALKGDLCKNKPTIKQKPTVGYMIFTVILRVDFPTADDTSKFGRRSFSIAAPMVWNSFPYSLQDPTLSIDNRSALKTRLFVVQWDT